MVEEVEWGGERKSVVTDDGKDWLRFFMEFLENLSIDSKEAGVTRLKDVMYDGQRAFVEEVCRSISGGIHNFVILKARQLGITTITLAMDLFWLGVHPAMQGALITDNEANRDKFRIILDRYLENLPSKYRIGIKNHNRNNLVFENGSVLDYLVAGTRKTGNLGRGRAFNFVHATECSSWGDETGLASLKASLAESHPDRLYIFESTAKGFNLFHDMWRKAGEDELTQKRIFLGWWSKQEYSANRGGKIFKKFWDGKLTETEREFVDTVKKDYGVLINDEQVAWYRWKEESQISGENMMAQEFPWTAEQAFVSTGKGFFNRRMIAKSVKDLWDEKKEFQAYRYHMGDDFLATEIEDLKKTLDDGLPISFDDMELKVWEAPKERGTYVLGVDPAFGRSDNKDRHVIEVFRCYADKAVQVAEYCTDNYESRQCAWVMCHLAGLYRRCLINIEVTGPGALCMSELDHLRQLMAAGYLSDKAQKMGIMNVFGSVSWYLYHRPDSMGAGYAYNWKTTLDNKFLILNQFRDLYSTNALRLASNDLLQEMNTLVQDGSHIEGSGSNKDDRVMGTALALEAWVKWVRPGMISRGETFLAETEKDEASKGRIQTFLSGLVVDTFARKERERVERENEAMWETR